MARPTRRRRPRRERIFEVVFPGDAAAAATAGGTTKPGSGKALRRQGKKGVPDMKTFRDLTAAILRVGDELVLDRRQRKEEFEWHRSHHGLATKEDLKGMEKRIMSAISEFAAKQKEFNDRQDAAVTGLTEDVQTLNDKITELQNTAGAITPEDQALLDDIQARGEAITTKLEALDALTPPKPPPA